MGPHLHCWLSALLLIHVVLQGAIAAEQNPDSLQDGTKRIKVRRKLVAKADPVAANLTSTNHDNFTASDEANEADRDGRGFLDDYYAKYEERALTNNQNHRLDDQMAVASQPKNDLGDNQSASSAAAIAKLQDLLSSYPRMRTESTLSAGGEKYIQHLSLPHNDPDDKAYMYSAALANDFDFDTSSLLGSNAKVMTSGHKQILPMLKNKVIKSDLDDLSSSYGSSSYEGPTSFYDFPKSASYSPSSSSSYQSGDALGKFFGITGTTSPDIQLGLTFTVPFLSIPLTSLNSVLSGNGLSDMMNFNFTTSTIVTVIILGALLIFVVPQIIYWLTGVNLSAFNWGRNDNEGLNLNSLAHVVDEALIKYDIDTRTCLARTLCSEYQKRNKEQDQTISRVNRGLMDTLVESKLVQSLMGESRIKEAVKLGSETKKECRDHYTGDVCPWDASAMIKIVSGLIRTGNVDFSSIAASLASNMAAKTPQSPRKQQ